MNPNSTFTKTKVLFLRDEQNPLIRSTTSTQDQHEIGTRSARDRQKISTRSARVLHSSQTATRGRNSRKTIPKRSNIIEPVIFLYLMAKALSDTIITNLLENRTCMVELNLPDRNCSEPISATVEDLIQPFTADVIMARSLVEALIPSMLTLLVGPWSDGNGRKPFLIIALLGQTVSYLIWGCLSLLNGIQPPTFLFACLPISFSGGSPVIFLLAYCYVTDVTDNQTRPFRLSVLTVAKFTSSIVGVAFAPMIVAVQHTFNPYPLVFFISTGLLALTVIYTIYFISETVDVRPDSDKDLFKASLVTHMCEACFSRRDGYARSMILTIVSCIAVNNLATEGEGVVLFLSAKEMFYWSLPEYTIFLCVNCVNGPGSVIGVWLFTSVLGLTNMQSATLALATRIVRSPIMALATAGWQFYLANTVCFLSCAYGPLVRSELGLLAPRKDLGKIFALSGFLESLAPVVGTPVYTIVYTATYLHAPGTVYWLSAGITVTTALLLLSIVIAQRIVSGACYANNGEETSNYVRVQE